MIKDRPRKRSISASFRLTYIFIILIMIIPIGYSMVVLRIQTRRYDSIISNVAYANYLSSVVQQDLSSEIWAVVAGTKRFNDGQQYIMLRQVRVGIADMMKSASASSREVLEVASRTEKTLEKYVQLLGAQIEMKSPVSENENAMEQIRGVSALLGDLMQEFIIAEIEGAEVTNENTRRSSFFLFVIEIAIGILAAVVAYFASVGISQTIRRPIHKMEELSTRIARGELSARAEMPHVEELDNLASNLNTMAKRIQELIDENILEQKNLKKAEMKTLQAQITPHFLYNTLDTIIWLAESEENDDVVEITKAFSNFFRISLSRGHEWITVARELEHVSSYLTIQKIRYPNILTYEIISDEGLDEVPVLKLLLQPLVENAIYHGLKNKRGRGKIMVSVKRIDAFGMTGGGIRFTVEDNGLGFTPERLKEVLSEMSSSTEVESLQATYGLYNVNKRLELYYDKQVSLEIVSEYGMGTTVSFVVPVKAKVSEELDV